MPCTQPACVAGRWSIPDNISELGISHIPLACNPSLQRRVLLLDAMYTTRIPTTRVNEIHRPRLSTLLYLYLLYVTKPLSRGGRFCKVKAWSL